MSIYVTSTAFQEGQPIPVRFTADGDDESPPLSWTNVPGNTAELVLIVDDPDAPTDEPWVHWVLYNLPPTVSSLPDSIPHSGSPALSGANQGKNSWNTVGYRGPAPPHGHGTHHYHFHLYAIDIPLNLGPGADKTSLLQAMAGHVLSEGELIGTYQR